MPASYSDQTVTVGTGHLIEILGLQERVFFTYKSYYMNRNTGSTRPA